MIQMLDSSRDKGRVQMNHSPVGVAQMSTKELDDPTSRRGVDHGPREPPAADDLVRQLAEPPLDEVQPRA